MANRFAPVFLGAPYARSHAPAFLATASHIAGPGNRLSLDVYGSSNGNQGLPEPFSFRQEILERLDVVGGYPPLDSGFESSLAGLHFLGATAARTFGPLVRFVAGTQFASQALTRRILRTKEG